MDKDIETTYKISSRSWGIECRFCCVREGLRDINDIVMLPTIGTDPAPLIADKIAAIDAMDVSESDQCVGAPAETPSILLSVEDDKERLKWMAVAAIRVGITADEFIAPLDWQDAGIAQALIYSYAQQAHRDGYIQGVPTTKEGCWAVLSGVVLSMTDEQLRGVL